MDRCEMRRGFVSTTGDNGSDPEMGRGSARKMKKGAALSKCYIPRRSSESVSRACVVCVDGRDKPDGI